MSEPAARLAARERSANDELRRGWKVLAACLVGACLSVNALPFYTLGVFATPIVAEFGWTRADYQVAVSLFAGCLLTTAPFVGALMDRFGPRRVALVSLGSLALGFVAASRATSAPWTFYLAWLVIAGAGAGASTIAWTRMINSWFDRRRGLALGIALAGTGITATVAPPLVSDAIVAYGWRSAYLLLAGVVLCVALPVVALAFREPRPGDERLAGRAEPRSSGATDLTLRQALRTRTFWTLMAVFALISIAVGGLIANLVPILIDAGHAPGAAGRLAAGVGLAVIVSRIACGWLLDRVWAPGLAAVVFVAPAAASLILLGNGADPAAALLAAVLVGMAGGAEFDIVAYLASRHFGRRHYGRIYGCLFAAIQAGVAMSGLVFGLGYGEAAGYAAALQVTFAVSIAAGVLILLTGRYDVGADVAPVRSSSAAALGPDPKGAG